MNEPMPIHGASSSQASDVSPTDSILPWGPSVKIARPLADVILRFGDGNTELPQLEFPPVRSIEGVESARGSVDESHGQALVSLADLHGDLYDRSPIQVTLADSSILEAEHVASISNSGSVQAVDTSCQQYMVGHVTRLSLSRWRWTSNQKPVAWVGLLRGAKIHHHNWNLALGGRGYTSATSLRLRGNATWHLLSSKLYGEEHCIVVLDETGGHDEQLVADFLALEFLFGTPLRLELLVGVNSNNVPVAAIGTDLGCEFQTKEAHPPIPFSEMGDAKWPNRTRRDGRNPNWMAIAFPLIARALGEKDLTPTSAAISAYVGSMVGFIDAQYLMAQVGLEALADRIKTGHDEKPVVKDLEKWEQWVESMLPSLQAHAVDAESLDTLVNKSRSSGQPTTTALVERVLKRLGIDAPKEALREIRNRGNVAHSLSMTRGKPYDAERELRRVRMIRALLAALLLRHVGYDGALQGWDRNGAGWATPAEWFQASDRSLATARTLHEASVP